MIITVLTENTSCDPALGSEHGLSLFIEADGKKILFDSGQSGLFAENARKLGVDLSEADMMILSHGHYDHGGGISVFLQINGKAPVYVSRFAFSRLYNAEGREIGLDPSLKENPRIVFCEDLVPLSPNLTICSLNERPRGGKPGSFGLQAERDGRIQPDDFRHEQYLLIREGEKRILISGCSHKWILDIVNWFRPDIMIGGFHFMRLPLDDKLIGYAKRLDRSGTEFYTCHCTGTAQYEYMKPYMSRLHYISTGMRLEIP